MGKNTTYPGSGYCAQRNFNITTGMRPRYIVEEQYYAFAPVMV